MISRRVSVDAWERVLPHTYLTTPGDMDRARREMAAWLWAGRAALHSHVTAGRRTGLEGCDDGTVHLLVPGGKRAPVDWLVVHRADDLQPGDFTERRFPPLTRPARTIVDVAATHPDSVEAVLDAAIRERLVSPRYVLRTLERLGSRGRTGAKHLRRLLDERMSGTRIDSALQRRVRTALLQDGLPRPATEFYVYDGKEFVARVDLAYPARLVAIEADSIRWHTGRAAWQRELIRRRRLGTLGWRVIPVTDEDLRLRRREVLDIIRAAIGYPCIGVLALMPPA